MEPENRATPFDPSGIEIELEGFDNSPAESNAPGPQAIDITSPNTVNLPKGVVEERAQKAHLGLGANSPGVSSLRESIARGDEQYARQTSADELRLKERDNRLTMLTQLANARVPGSPVSQDEIDLTSSLTIEPTVDPRTVWEKQYGNYLTNRLVMDNDDPSGAINGALTENPAGTYADLDVARDLITKSERVNARLSEMEAKWKEMGWWESAGTIAETIIPGKSSLNLSGRSLTDILDMGEFVNVIALPGKNLREQIQSLRGIADPDAFAAKLDEVVDRIADTNIIDAIDFLKAVQSYSPNEQFIKNAFGLADVTDVGALAGAITKGLVKGGTKIGNKVLTKAEAERIKAVDDTLKATVGPQHPEKIAAQIGATEESATMKVIQRRTIETDPTLPATFADRVRVITDMMPTFAKPGNIFKGESSLSNAQAVRLTSVLENNIARFVDTVTTTISPERLPPEALQAAVQAAKEEIRKDYTRVSDAVLDVVQNPRDPFSNTDSVSIRIGKPDANTFTSSDEAKLYARDIYELPLDSYSVGELKSGVGQQGTAFYIDIMKPIRETATEAQDLIVNTNNQSPIPNLMTMFIQGMRTPAEITSAFQKANRDAALLGNVNFTNMLSEVAAPIGNLTKNQRKDLGKIMDANRDFHNAAGERGRYYDTIQDLDEAYLTKFNRLPTDAEAEAYYSAVQINEMDLMLRNFTAYRDLSRQGIEEFQVRMGYEGYSEYTPAKFTLSGKFKGREAEYIPWSDPNLLPVAVIDEAGGTPRMVYKSSTQADRDWVESLVKDKGYKIIQVARPQERVLKDSANLRDPVQWIVTKSHTKSPLEFQQVGRSPGFHVEYADPYYIKQPRVSIIPGGSRAYEGDATLWSVGSRAQGLKFEQRVNELRQAIKDGVEDLTPYISNKLPENEAWWRAQFAEDGYFNIDQPFKLVSKGQNTRDVDNSLKQIRDLTDSQHTLTSDMDRKFQGERSQQLLSPVEGTEENPAIKLRPSRMVDAMTSTSQGIGQATRSRYFGDMKISVADQFVNEFSDLMTESVEELRKYPMYFLHNPPWREGQGVDQARLAAAKAIQKTTMEFAGRQTPFGKTFDWVQTKLADSVYQATGEKGTKILNTMTDLANTRDPLSFLRSWAFRAKMGFFNVNQIFVQSQGLAHMLAINPKDALQSFAAYLPTRALMFNDKPEIVSYVAQKMMTKLGWKAEHFEESFALLKRTGWQNVGREATFIDDMSDPKLYEGTVGKFLDKSAIFFTETERMIRLSSWHSAYREWRAANPRATVTNAELGKILSRADTMTLNMTNASKASWERGVLSIPAQFQSYNVRLFEQFWGGQLTLAEKARVMGVTSALYGVPVGLSGVLAYPLYEDIRQYALENGYNVSDKYIDGMIEGLPALLMSSLGMGEFNFGQRFGPGGISLFKDLKDNDKTLLQAAMGPGGSVFTDLALGALPAGTAMLAQMVSGKNYEPEANDVLDALRTISTVNNGYRVWAAMQYGKYISRKGVVLSESSPYSAAVSAATGLQPREFTDKMIMNDSLKDLNKYQRDLQTEIQKYGSRALIEYSNGNKDAGDAYMKKASSYIELGDFTPSQKTSIVSNIVQGKNRTLADRIRRDWVMKGPSSKRAERLKNMESNP